MPRRVARLEAGPDLAFAWGDDQLVTWEDAPVARLRRGATALRPVVEVRDSEFLDGAARERVRARVQRFVDDTIRRELAPLFAAEERAQAHAALRGPLHRLTESLGLVPGATEDAIPPTLRGVFKPLGVRAGRFALFLPALLKPRAMALRARLWGLQHRVPVPRAAAPGLVSMAPPANWPAGFAAAMGWIEAGPILLRLDVAERIAAELAHAARRGPTALPAGLASRFSAGPEFVPAILRCLGFRVMPARSLGPDEYGPPSPATILPARRRRPVQARPEPAPARAGPFAALAALRP
jgi:ATP-dependent RNA helicase SUPV3L1/SUV3